jgi:hypothetical protein
VIGASAQSLLYRRRLSAGERLYGLGDKTVPLERRGRRYLLWNTDALNFRAGSDPLYKSIAVLFGVRGDAAWAIVVDSAASLRGSGVCGPATQCGPTSQTRAHGASGPSAIAVTSSSAWTASGST